MKIFRPILAAVLLNLAFLPNLAQAEDIDIYTGSPPTGDVNVLFVLDNESNWAATMDNNPPQGAIDLCGANDAGSYFCAQKYALITLLQKVNGNGSYFVPENVGIGLMMYGNGDNKGSYVRFGVRKLTAANRAALIALLTDMPVDDKGSSQQDFGMVMWEAFKYFGGGPAGNSPQSSTAWGPIPTYGVGTGTDKRDYSGNGTAGSAASYGAGGPWALDSSSTVNTGGNPVKYLPPAHTTECGKNYLVYIGHSNSQDNINNNQPPAAHFVGVGAPTGRVNNTAGKEVTGSYGDEGARYLFNNDVDPNTNGVQNVITYTIGAYESPCTGQVCGMITTMKSMANVGGGSYYDATSIEKLVDAIGAILTEIQGTPSVFISASLPISVNTQGTYLNQVFVGMFQPEKDGSPKWLGNLKQFKIKYDPVTGSARLGDADNRDAIDASTGFVSVLARSYWTTSSTFWTNWVPLKTASASDSPDGPEVQKGAAAQRQREANLTTQASRKVYTCAVDGSGAPNCATGSLSATPFNTTTLPPGNAGTVAAFNYPAAWTATTSAATDIGDLIAWVRGTDNLLNEAGPGGTTTIRPTIHGDVLHSRPVALNYAGRVVVFYGSNEGMLRAVEGRQTGSGAGEELWTFVAPDFLNRLNRLRQQTPILILPSDPAGSPTNKDYFLDGPIGAYQEGSTAILYVAARRGGRFIYAIDVSNPDDPKFKFKLSPSTTGMGNLGQTWSLPKVTKIRNGPASGRVVLIFGGGYDVAEDLGSAGSLGRGVYVVDALTGAVIKHFLTATDGSTISTSVPSEVTIVNVDRDPSGFVDRAYVGDLAGNVWRMDLDDGTTNNDATGWRLHKLATLGARKFFFPPDVVLGQDFHAVLIGSGNREDPRATVSSDKFYMLKDAYVGLNGTGQAPIVAGDLVANTADSSNAKGWYYTLNPAGEKVVNAPLTIGGVVYFGTNKPNTVAACAQPDLGEARSYAMNFYDGSGARPAGGGADDAYSIVLNERTGLPPSPMFGLVDMGGGDFVPVCVGCGGGGRRSAFEAEVPTTDPSPVRSKVYWKVKSDK